jgi:NAD(P)-dependent dehydrogenase (short-subunit alcohol dehydrogenase family)
LPTEYVIRLVYQTLFQPSCTLFSIITLLLTMYPLLKGLICPAYNASKAGVIQLGRNLASEWGVYGIRVNTISPGYIVTAMVEDLFVKFPERREDWPTQNMLGRLSKPQEYRGAAVFLLSDASSFMTGSDLRMDGGHAAW